MRVYIAGPYTQGNPVHNTKLAIMVAEEIIDAGHIPYVPHLNLLWDLVAPHSPEFWYDYDLEWLGACDCLLRLPGESAGADREVAYAKGRGIPVYTRESIPGII